MISERLLNETSSPWWGEHVHRYQVVIGLIPKNSTVLDLACGTGFGSLKLAEASLNVCGGDISTEAIDYCRNTHKHERLTFKVLDGTKLPFENNHFDAIVSFETIEHTTEFDKMLEEFKRTLKPQGVIYLSTPNFIVNSPSGVVTNPFHTQEWTYDQLNKILKNHFKNVELLGQEYSRYLDETGVIRNKFSNSIENLLYMRGVRKLPIKVQDMIMKSLMGKPMYPLADDYRLTSDITRIKKCKTFFAICKP